MTIHSLVDKIEYMADFSPKTNPRWFFTAHVVHFRCQLHDLSIVLEKTEMLKFKQTIDMPQETVDEGLIFGVFPDLLRKGFIVTLLIIFEDQMRGFCELLAQAENIPIKWNQLRGSALKRFRLYVTKLGTLELDIDDNLKSQIKGLIEARNCIVHSNSRLAEYRRPQVVKDFCQSMDGVSCDSGVIEFSHDACNACADIVKAFMEKAYHATLVSYPDLNMPKNTD